MPGRTDIPFAIGSHSWPGLAKLAEECGETQQIIGKIMAFPDTLHPDGAGNQWDRLADEMGDLLAAISYVAPNSQMSERVLARSKEKKDLFWKWHTEARAAE